VAGQVLQLDLADEDVAVEVDDVVAVHRQLQLAVVEADAGRQRVAEVALADRPVAVVGPAELVLPVRARHVRVHAEPARPLAGVVLLPDVREVDVPHLVPVVERHQQPAVADGDVTGHALPSLSTQRAMRVVSPRPARVHARGRRPARKGRRGVCLFGLCGGTLQIMARPRGNVR
jgi:hypothetical protein